MLLLISWRSCDFLSQDTQISVSFFSQSSLEVLLRWLSEKFIGSKLGWKLHRLEKSVAE